MEENIVQVRELLKAQGLSGVFMADNNNILFYSGLPITKSAVNAVLYTLQQFNPTVLYINAAGEKVYFTSASLSQFIEENLPDARVYYYPTNLFIDYWKKGSEVEVYASDISRCLRKFIGENRLEGMPAGADGLFYSQQNQEFSALTEINGDLQKIRYVKTPESLEKIHIAAKAAYEAMGEVQRLVEGGGALYEDDLFYGVRKVLLSHHCQWDFTTVACGKYSADIFHQPLHYQLQPGDTVRLDLGAAYQNYTSDIARTFFYPGEADRYKEVYRVVCEAQKLVLSHIRDGVKTADLFHIGQNYVREHGYPQYTRTMIGHGVGIETEENPFLSPQSDAVLKEGMVMSIELPFYIKGLAGVNIEDIIVVTKDGYKILN